MITVATSISGKINTIWELWTNPQHIIRWNHASDDWHTTKATNELRPGGKFCYRMEAKDGSMGFDYEGVYTKICPFELLEYELLDGRKVKIVFSQDENEISIKESFEPEKENSEELQKNGWQAILDNFKNYALNRFGRSN